MAGVSLEEACGELGRFLCVFAAGGLGGRRSAAIHFLIPESVPVAVCIRFEINLLSPGAGPCPTVTVK